MIIICCNNKQQDKLMYSFVGSGIPGDINKKTDKSFDLSVSLWALRDSNPRPSACKADALNQLS